MREGGRRRLEAALDLPVPSSGDRLRGTVTVEGPDRAPTGEPEDGHHLWSPLVGPAAGQADLGAGGWRFQVRGEAYHDRNGGDRPLHELGIHDWAWGRAVVGDAQWIYYLVAPEDGAAPPLGCVLRLGADGSTTRWDDVVLTSESWRPSTFGPSWRQRLILHHQGEELLRVRQSTPVDDGPFYLRLPIALQTPDGRSGMGWGERVWPGRIDLARHRPFVRMRVDKPGRNSMWLPLFSGPPAGRLRRLVGAS